MDNFAGKTSPFRFVSKFSSRNFFLCNCTVDNDSARLSCLSPPKLSLMLQMVCFPDFRKCYLPMVSVFQVHSYGTMGMPCTQCEVLDVGKYSNSSFGPLSQVFGSVPGFFWLPKHLGCGIFELSTISP